MMLSAQLKKHGHYVEVFINSIHDLIKGIKNNRFDLVCFTMMGCDTDWVQQNARWIKSHDSKIPIAVGGPHPTFFNSFILENLEIDILCVGEGDAAIVELAEAIEQRRDYRNIINLHVRVSATNIVKNSVRPIIQDLDRLPFCDRSIYEKYRYFNNVPFTNIIASRGCPYNCSFCFNHQYNEIYANSKYRLRSPENIISEVKEIQRSGRNINLLMFVDSTFNLDRGWCLEFFQLYKENLDVKFTINVTAGRIDDELVEAIAKTDRCKAVRFAVETGNERLRREVLRKPFSDKQLLQAASCLRQKKISIVVFLMFAIPFENLANTLETIELTQKIKPDFVQGGLFFPYRGLKITQTAIDNGFLTEQDLARFENPNQQRFDSVLRLEDIDRIKNIFLFHLSMIHYPRSQSLLKKLSEYKCNPFFKLFFMACMFLQSRRYVEIGLIRSLYESYYHRLEY
jgi:radical SAM superfamily enzyme YgiQ (UPF0313 family)